MEVINSTYFLSCLHFQEQPILRYWWTSFYTLIFRCIRYIYIVYWWMSTSYILPPCRVQLPNETTSENRQLIAMLCNWPLDCYSPPSLPFLNLVHRPIWGVSVNLLTWEHVYTGQWDRTGEGRDKERGERGEEREGKKERGRKRGEGGRFLCTEQQAIKQRCL